MNDLLTIYITNYNYGKYLKKSIRSVLNQNYKKLFLIIIDDASTDNSKKILSKFEKKSNIKIFYNKKKTGLVKSANLAIKNAKGKYILRLDADDYLKKNAIKILYSEIKNKKNIKMVFPNFFWVNDKNKIISKFNYEHKSNYSLLDYPAHGACALIDLEFLKKINGYCEKFDRQDGFYLWLSIILKKYKIKHIKNYLFFYRKHKKNLSNNFLKLYKTRNEIINFFINKKIKKKQLLILKDKTNKIIKSLK